MNRLAALLCVPLLFAALPAESVGTTPLRTGDSPGGASVELDPLNAIVGGTEGDAATVEKYDSSGFTLGRVATFASGSGSALVAREPGAFTQAIAAGTTVRTDGASPCAIDVCVVAKIALTPRAVLWQVPTPGAATAWTHVEAIAVDAAGDVYVATSAYGARAAVAKLDHATGATLWRRVLAVDGVSDLGIAVAPAGGIFVTGGFGTARISSAGTTLWARSETGRDVVADPATNAIVTGAAGTIKFSPAGDIIWRAPTQGASLAISAELEVIIASTTRTQVAGGIIGGVVAEQMLHVTALELADGAPIWRFSESLGKPKATESDPRVDVSIGLATLPLGLATVEAMAFTVEGARTVVYKAAMISFCPVWGVAPCLLA